MECFKISDGLIGDLLNLSVLALQRLFSLGTYLFTFVKQLTTDSLIISKKSLTGLDRQTFEVLTINTASLSVALMIW